MPSETAGMNGRMNTAVLPQSDAGMVVDDSSIDFTIRWCKKAAEIDNTHFRVEFNGELYNIAAVDHMNYRRKSIKLSCEKVRR